jgi:hypothetical protein
VALAVAQGQAGGDRVVEPAPGGDRRRRRRAARPGPQNTFPRQFATSGVQERPQDGPAAGERSFRKVAQRPLIGPGFAQLDDAAARRVVETGIGGHLATAVGLARHGVAVHFHQDVNSFHGGASSSKRVGV